MSFILSEFLYHIIHSVILILLQCFSFYISRVGILNQTTIIFLQKQILKKSKTKVNYELYFNFFILMKYVLHFYTTGFCMYDVPYLLTSLSPYERVISL